MQPTHNTISSWTDYRVAVEPVLNTNYKFVVYYAEFVGDIIVLLKSTLSTIVPFMAL